MPSRLRPSRRLPLASRRTTAAWFLAPMVAGMVACGGDDAVEQTGTFGPIPVAGLSGPVAARLANEHARLGDLYADAGALTEAIVEYRRAVQLGAAFSKQLFTVLEPTAVVWLRLVTWAANAARACGDLVPSARGVSVQPIAADHGVPAGAA